MVGAGAGGVELLLALQFALQQMLAGSDRPGQVPELHLFGAGETILPTHNPGVRRRLEGVLQARGVHVHLGQPVTAVREGAVVIGDGLTVRLDEILWVTQAGAPPWPGAAGLAVDDEGFIQATTPCARRPIPTCSRPATSRRSPGTRARRPACSRCARARRSPATCAASSSGAAPGRFTPSAGS